MLPAKRARDGGGGNERERSKDYVKMLRDGINKTQPRILLI